LVVEVVHLGVEGGGAVWAVDFYEEGGAVVLEGLVAAGDDEVFGAFYV
jgi:hypothetical protein